MNQLGLGVLQQESYRLLRENWPDVNELAEELFAMFNSLGLPIAGPVEVSNPTSQPGITVTQPASDTPAQPLTFNIGHQDPLYPVLTDQPYPGSLQKRSSLIVRQVTVKEIHDDFLIVDDPRDSGFLGASIAKPPGLRGNITSAPGITSFAYTSSDYQARTATFPSGTFTLTENQVVIPPYAAGGTLYVIEVAHGVFDNNSTTLATVTWIDLNVDGRTWAVQLPSDDLT